MEIAYIIPGTGGQFYCENCLRDVSFTKCIRESGHKVIMVPIYLPVTLNNSDFCNNIPLFYGAVNVYLEEIFPFYNKLPDMIKKIMNSKTIMKFISKLAGTSAKGLEELTISMLQGSSGRQNEELEKLCNWLKEIVKPDIIHLSNALLSGMAEKLKQETGAAVICSLQDEDQWVDSMAESYQDRVWNIMAAKAKNVDAFITVSAYYYNFIRQKLAIDKNKIS